MSMAAVAIGTTVVAVGGAAISAGMQADAAGKAAGATASAGKKLRKQQEATTGKFEKQQRRLQKEIRGIQTAPVPQFDLGTAIPQAIGGARQITDYNLEQRRRILPGIEQMDMDISNKIQALLSGKSFTEDELGALQREVAERGGFNIATSGRSAIPGVAQTSQFDFARALGTTRQQNFMAGFNLQQTWQNSAGQFIQGALPVAQFAESSFQGRTALQQANQRMELTKLQTIADMNNSMYGAQMGVANTGYETAQRATADRLAADQAVAQGVGDVSAAIGQSGTSLYGSYGKYATAKAAGGGATGSIITAPAGSSGGRTSVYSGGSWT
jgi:hypothetical protein